MRNSIVVSVLSFVLFAILLTPSVLSGDETGPQPIRELGRDLGGAPGQSTPETEPAWWNPTLVAEFFGTDPLFDPEAVVVGAALDRLTWEDSDPAWPGDRRGSLSALYDSSLPAGLFGFELSRVLDEADGFTAAATLVLDPDEFDADPNGFFQISWGLWNRESTGLNRTGNLTSFASDSFELLEFDYFPNVSPFFGGPFVSPTLLGVSDPSVDPPDAFANAAFAFNLQAELPLGEPLLVVIEHRPGLDVAVVSVHRIVKPRRTVPVPGAVTVIDLENLGLREYEFDAVGLTLWNDGFGGPDPALRARVDYHSLIVRRGRFLNVDQILRVRPRFW